MRPKPYNPAKACVPWWWTWGGIWKNGERYGVWPIASKHRRRCKKKERKADKRGIKAQ